jgi:ubiquitin C-terminal hydrolase
MERENYHKIQPKYCPKENMFIYEYNNVKYFIKDNYLYIPNNLPYESEVETSEFASSSQTENKKNNQIMEPCGLVNNKGVCYMNAVLQCFYYCKPLTQFFLNLNENKKNQLELISKGYCELVEGLSKGNINAAKTFKEAIEDYDDMFSEAGGNDSKDVALLILTELHNELKQNKFNEIIQLNKKVNYHELKEVYEEKLALDKINNNSTIISQVFNYFLKIEQKCINGCKKYKKTYFTIETDNIVILELNSLFLRDNITIHLEDCIARYIKEKMIECPECKMKSLKFKNIFCTLPKILIFVLSRGLNNNFKCKIKFKEDLDMNEYYEPITQDEAKKSTKYKLICATFAYDWMIKGTGHTVAFCKTNYKDQYYIFNDRTARKTKISEINGKMPYLLFYEREENN